MCVDKVIYTLIAVVIGSGLIQIMPLKINPWHWLASYIKNLFVGDIQTSINDLNDNVKNLDKMFQAHIKSYEETNARSSRQRILNFNDDVVQGRRFSHETWNQVLEDIDTYEKFCMEHPEYPNNKCQLAIKNIKDRYYDIINNIGEEGFLE